MRTTKRARNMGPSNGFGTKVLSQSSQNRLNGLKTVQKKNKLKHIGADKIASLKVAFLLEPPECVIEEDEDLEDENSDDEDDA